MIDLKKIYDAIADGLGAELGCEVVLSNQNAPIPKYPYVSFTMLTDHENAGTWGIEQDGTYTKPKRITFSFTSQSDVQMESFYNASKLRTWFELKGCIYLNDLGIMVERVGDITSRDNLLTTGYEYRYGLDAIVSIMDTETMETEYIETAEIKEVTNNE